MPSPLQAAGAAPIKETHYAPLHVNTFFTGLWTNGSPLREGAVPFLYQKFYGGSRFDTIRGGVNAELSSRLTLVRSPGHSVYNSQTFGPVNSFYEFRLQSTTQEVIKVMLDQLTPGAVYDATGPSTKRLIFNKAAGAGQTYFQNVGNTLYMGDGVDLLEWVQTLLVWAAATVFNAASSDGVPADFIVDANNNVQQVTGILATVTNVAVSGNIGTVTAANNYSPGMLVTFTGVGTATFLNGQQVTLTSATATQFTFAFTHANYGPTADTGTALSNSGSGTSGGSLPAFSSTLGGTVNDGSIQWTCKGSSVRSWGNEAPPGAPSVANAALPAQFASWAASTFYSPSLLLLDTNGNLQLLTTKGTTGTSQPAWNVTVGGTTADNAGGGTAVWTNQGTAAWQSVHTYAAGIYVAASYSVTVLVPNDSGSGDVELTINGHQPPQRQTYTPVTVNYADFFKCTTPGVSGGSTPAWQTGVGTVVKDGTAVWTNISTEVKWTGAGTNPTIVAIGASTLVEVAQSISDSNGNIQNVTVPGKSGGTVPTWATAQGATTLDSGTAWVNQGPSGQTGNTGTWIYCYNFEDSVTGDVGPRSILSAPITQAAGSYILVQGAGSTDFKHDMIKIYRTAQGGSAELFLITIPAPAPVAGVAQPWQYADTNPDSVLDPEDIAPGIENSAPPAGLIGLTFHGERVWGGVGNVLYRSGGPDILDGNGSACFAPLDTFTYPSKYVRALPTAIGLLVWTVASLYIVTGNGTPGNPYESQPFLPGLGIKTWNAVTVNGSLIYAMLSTTEVLSLDPSTGVSDVGFPIGDQFENTFDATSVYLTWHSGGSRDKALYVADGSGSWFRMNPTPAPETGLTWSPRRVVAAGMKAVQSVEVTPGSHLLLLGPVTSGPILFRDVTRNTDNGVTYTWDVEIGNVVLAQPGQMAEIEFIATCCVKVGTRPTVGVSMGEIAGPYETLPAQARTNDPPKLPVSKTIYSDRWNFLDGDTSWCEHLRMKFAFAAEDAANELLTYTLYGAILQE